MNSENEALWKPNFSEKINNLVSDDGFCHTILDTVMYYSVYEDHYALIVFSTFKYDNGLRESCHVCAPIIGLATFKRTLDTNWELNKFQKNFMFDGSYGKRNKLDLIKLGDYRYCLTCSGGYGNNGSFESWVQYYSLEEDDDFNVVFSYSKYISDEAFYAGEKGSSQESSIKFIHTKNPYYTIVLNTKSSTTKQIINEIFNYSPRENRYVIEKKAIVNPKK